MGAYIGLALTQESLAKGGVLLLGISLFLMALGAAYIIAAGSKMSKKKYYESINHAGLAILLLGLMTFCAEGAGLSRAVLSAILIAWLGYSLVSGYLARFDGEVE
jgi:Ca2+/Na+ antiporter